MKKEFKPLKKLSKLSGEKDSTVSFDGATIEVNFGLTLTRTGYYESARFGSAVRIKIREGQSVQYVFDTAREKCEEQVQRAILKNKELLLQLGNICENVISKKEK